MKLGRGEKDLQGRSQTAPVASEIDLKIQEDVKKPCTRC